jgi:hypothetical protein
MNQAELVIRYAMSVLLIDLLACREAEARLGRLGASVAANQAERRPRGQEQRSGE